MIHRITRFRRRLLALVALLLVACGGEASKYSGIWKRDLYGEGEVQDEAGVERGLELMLPSPRWPDSVDMKGRAAFTGDTLIFKADTREPLSDRGRALRREPHRERAAHRGPGHGYLRRPPGGAGGDVEKA